MFGTDTWLSLLWIFFCIVLIIGLAYWFTRFIGERGRLAGLGAARGTARIQVLSRTSLGKDQTLTLVQVEQRFLLLGSTPGGISLLAEFTPEEVSAWSSRGEPPEAGQSMSFKKALQTVIKQKRQG